MEDKLYYSYDEIHQLISRSSVDLQDFNPDIIIAIGGGGFIPGRIIRTFLNKPLYSVVLKLYDENDGPGDQVKILQWLDVKALHAVKGKRILIVDEVDDTRQTLEKCTQLLRDDGVGEIGIFVLHDKIKPKKGNLTDVRMMCGENVNDKWIVYPWENKQYRMIPSHFRTPLGH